MPKFLSQGISLPFLIQPKTRQKRQFDSFPFDVKIWDLGKVNNETSIHFATFFFHPPITQPSTDFDEITRENEDSL